MGRGDWKSCWPCATSGATTPLGALISPPERGSSHVCDPGGSLPLSPPGQMFHIGSTSGLHGAVRGWNPRINPTPLSRVMRLPCPAPPCCPSSQPQLPRPHPPIVLPQGPCSLVALPGLGSLSKMGVTVASPTADSCGLGLVSSGGLVPAVFSGRPAAVGFLFFLILTCGTTM